MREEVSFFVPGIPKPAGSKRGFVLQRPGMKPRAIITDDCKTSKDWKADVKAFARQRVTNVILPLHGPLVLDVLFVMPRPKSHYRTGRHASELRPDAPLFHTSKPDATKLLRCVEDAMTGIIWNDDAQVSQQAVAKMYGPQPGASIKVRHCIFDNPPSETRVRQAEAINQGVAT